MTDLTLQEKKQLLLDAITTVDQITEEVKDNYPFDDTEGEHLNGGETWDAQNYKKFLIRKLGAIEYELQNNGDNTEETTTQEKDGNNEDNTQTENNEAQTTQQNNNTTENEEEDEEEVKP